MRWKDEMTNTSGGIRMTRQQIFTPTGGERQYYQDVAVLLTDGESNRDTQWTATEARAAKANGIILFVVGVGQSLNMQEIRDIASDPDIDHVFIARDFDQLRDIIAEPLHEQICKMTSRKFPKGRLHLLIQHTVAERSFVVCLLWSLVVLGFGYQNHVDKLPRAATVMAKWSSLYFVCFGTEQWPELTQ